MSLDVRLKNLLGFGYYGLLRAGRRFTFHGQSYAYLHRWYNANWRNERAVEVPIVWRAVQAAAGRVLEVGNVLRHYYPVQHNVVDKYERAAGVLNIDLLDFRPAQLYDLIVSISTLEHIGWDETPREPGKLLRALDHVRALLSPGGQAILTAPLGYNPELDDLLRRDAIPWSALGCLRRTGRPGVWAEAAWAEVRGRPWPAYGNAQAEFVIIGKLSHARGL